MQHGEVNFNIAIWRVITYKIVILHSSVKMSFVEYSVNSLNNIQTEVNKCKKI